MEVLSLKEGLLTNVDVLELLEERRAERVVLIRHPPNDPQQYQQ